MVWDELHYWNMFAAGTDAQVKVPFERWDVDAYYIDDKQAAMERGLAYTCHGGFMTEQQLLSFDCDFFGVPEEDARLIVPTQRLPLEVGYECMHKASFTKLSTRGRNIGTLFGDVGADWHSFDGQWHMATQTPQGGRKGELAHMGTHASMNPLRLAHFLDLRGPVGSYDTACSASLVATAVAHERMMGKNSGCHQFLVMGTNTLLGPGSYIGNCAAGILTHVGRCFTFNHTADGYQRGEGITAAFLTYGKGDEPERGKLVDLVGSAINQDGRSASITAPNGPSQQACIRKSMALAGLVAKDISLAECHGTGTALGDPIECGALRGVMKGQRDGVPLPLTSAKSNIAHLEAAAGTAGLSKCVMMALAAAGPPNCHLNYLNPHLDIKGYPVHFDQELVELGVTSSCIGVSSFGFGGTNSRGDVYGVARHGLRKGAHIALPPSSTIYDYKPDAAVCISGSFNSWRTEDMVLKDGAHTFVLEIGSSQTAHFHLLLGATEKQAIYPVADLSDSTVPVLGPDARGSGKNWLIDGSIDGMPACSFYKVTFIWNETKKSISWEPYSHDDTTNEDET